MKRFKETNKEIYSMSKQEKLAHDAALISEAGDNICVVPLEKLKSKLLRDRHKKLCVDPQHWSTTKKKERKSIWPKAARAGLRGKLYNSLDEADIQNLIVHIQDITKDMIKAIKRNDQRTLDGLYKNLGKVIK